MVAVTASYSLPYSGEESNLWLPGTIRVAPLSVPEIRQRPDRIDGDRNVRTRQRNQLRILMDRLRLLAGAQHQRAERRQQAFPVQHALHHRQHVLVQRHFPEQIVIGEEIVDADGLEAFERRLGETEMMLALDALQRRLSILRPVRELAARFDDGESVVADPVGMGLNLGVRQHVTLP